MALTFGTTTNFLLRWLKGEDLISDIDEGFKALAEDIDSKMVGYLQDTSAKMPAAGIPHRLFKATDTGVVYLDTGSTWLPLTQGVVRPLTLAENISTVTKPTPAGSVVAGGGRVALTGYLKANATIASGVAVAILHTELRPAGSDRSILVGVIRPEGAASYMRLVVKSNGYLELTQELGINYSIILEGASFSLLA